jgi:hypothetical protein
MLAWIEAHTAVVGWLFGLSLVAFVATLVAIPVLVIRMSPDYFLRRAPAADSWRGQHPLARSVGRVLKNLTGVVLVAAGIAMLVLPGQGIITIFVGLTFLDFPRKRPLELLIVRQRPILWAINRMRAKADRPPLQLPPRAGMRQTGS